MKMKKYITPALEQIEINSSAILTGSPSLDSSPADPNRPILGKGRYDYIDDDEGSISW